MATRPAIPNRSSASRPAGPPLQSTPTTLISASATLVGGYPITLGPKSIIQIRAHLSSAHGPLTIGEACIISERTSIGALSPPPQSPDASPAPPTGTTLGPCVLIESGAVVEASSVGAYTIVESGAKVGRDAKIGTGCKISSGVELGEGAVVEDGVVVWGSGWGKWRSEGKGKSLDPLAVRRAWVGEMLEVLRRGWTGK